VGWPYEVQPDKLAHRIFEACTASSSAYTTSRAAPCGPYHRDDSLIAGGQRAQVGEERVRSQRRVHALLAGASGLEGPGVAGREERHVQAQRVERQPPGVRADLAGHHPRTGLGPQPPHEDAQVGDVLYQPSRGLIARTSTVCLRAVPRPGRAARRVDRSQVGGAGRAEPQVFEVLRPVEPLEETR